MGVGPDRIALAAFVSSSVLAGGNALGIRFSNRELDPLWGAAIRFALAAALLWLVAAALRVTLPRQRALWGALLFGALNFGASYALAYYSLVELHAGLGQTLLAVVPLATLLLSVAQRQERLRAGALAGTLIALAGIALVSRAPLREDVPLLSVLAALASAVCIAQAAIVIRRVPAAHPVAMNAIAMTIGAWLLVLGSLLRGETIELPQRGETWAALAYLVVVGSVLVFVLYLVVLRYWSASRAAYLFVVIPIVTVLLSARLDDEPIRAGFVAGGLLVLAGVYVGALRPSRAPDAQAEPALDTS